MRFIFMNEYKKKILAWLAFVAQIINGLIVIVQSVPLTSNAVELVANGQQKNVVPNAVIGFGLALLQAVLPRIQKKK